MVETTWLANTLSASFLMLRYFAPFPRSLVLAKMARLVATAGSLKSHQPRKEPRHGHGRRFDSGSQEVDRAAGTEGQRQAPGDPRGRRLPVARRQDVLPAGSRGGALRGSASGSDQPLPGAATVAETRYQLDLAAGTAGARGRRRPVCLHHRRHVDQSGRQENGKHLQHRQPEAAALQRASLRQEQARGEELPQLHDGPADHALGHPDSLQQAVSHPRVLREDMAWHTVPRPKRQPI